VSLAILTASSFALEAVERGDRGPRVSSLVMTTSVVTSVSTVGSKKLPPWAARLPSVTTLAPLLIASAMCASTFSTPFMSISGLITAPGSNAWATFIAPAISADFDPPFFSEQGCVHAVSRVGEVELWRVGYELLDNTPHVRCRFIGFGENRSELRVAPFDIFDLKAR
jgi:hypothetical protein